MSYEIWFPSSPRDLYLVDRQAFPEVLAVSLSKTEHNLKKLKQQTNDAACFVAYLNQHTHARTHTHTNARAHVHTHTHSRTTTTTTTTTTTSHHTTPHTHKTAYSLRLACTDICQPVGVWQRPQCLGKCRPVQTRAILRQGWSTSAC